MEESKQQQQAAQPDYAATFKEQNINQALFYIRQLKVHCILFVPANDIPENAQALLYSQLASLAALYKPGVATL
jgi:hypothetical protein